MIDEAHRWSWKLKSCAPILDHFDRPGNFRLGLSATPERGDGVALSKIFPAVALDYRYTQALDDGWCVPYDVRYVTVEGVDFNALETVRGDWRDGDLERALTEQTELATLVEPTIELVGDRSTLMFSPTTEVCRKVAAYLNAKRPGSAEWLDGSVPTDIRNATYDRHQRGQFQFLSVCGLCREGYNDPGIGAVAIYRPTKSRSLKEQMLGRGCRPLRGVLTGIDDPGERKRAIAESAKPDCMVVDLVGVSGLPNTGSVAELFADGEPDEVLSVANYLMTQGEETDPGKAIDRAKLHVEEQERQAKARERRLLEQAQLNAEAIRRERLDAQVWFESQSGEQIGIGQRVAPADLCSDKQSRFMWVLGFKRVNHYQVSKRQASRIISQLLKLDANQGDRKNPEKRDFSQHVVETNRLKRCR